MDDNPDPWPWRVGVLAALILLVLCQAAWAVTDDEQVHIAVYQRAARGVVNISSTVVTHDFFFRPIPQKGAGTGIVYDKKGHILTNNHVIDNAHRLEVTLHDGSQYPGELKGVYPEYDLAVIRIQAPAERLHPLPLGESDSLVVGQKVLAIGNPFGLGATLTTGVVSSLGRSVQTPQGLLMEDLIQTDASINPGNSGGPLLDRNGHVIGINTAILSPTGGSIGIGFAVPVSVARRVVPELITFGRVAYPWMGVRVFPVFPRLAAALNLPVDSGVLVVDVVEKSPADRAGIAGPTETVQIGNALLPIGGDVIVAFDGRAVNTTEQFIRALRRHCPKDRVTITVVRGRKTLDVDVALGRQPDSNP